MTRFRPRGQTARKPGTFGPDRDKWLVCSDLTVLAYLYEDGERALMFQEANRRPFRINLARITAAELVAMRDFITEVITEAIPMSEQLDLAAKAAWEEDSDDSAVRLYRSEPKLHHRKRDRISRGTHDDGPQPQYGEGLRVGPPGTTDLDADPDNPDDAGGPGADDGQVPDGDSPVLRPEDM